MFEDEPIIPTVWEIAEGSLIARGKRPTFMAIAYESGRLLLGNGTQSEVLMELPAVTEQPQPLTDVQGLIQK